MKYLIATLLIVFAPQLFADGGVETNGTEIPPENMAPSGSSGQSNNAMMQQMLGAGMNAAMGAQFASICPTVGGSWACPMAAMSFAQAGIMMMSAGQSGNTMDYSSGNYGFDPNDYMTTNPGFDEYGVGTTPEELEAFISEGTGNVNNHGYSYNPTTGVMTTPDGEFVVDEATAASAGALVKAAGGSASDMKLAESTAVSLGEKVGGAFGLGGGKGGKASVSGMGFNNHGGGSGSGSGNGWGKGGKGGGMGEYWASLNRKPSSKEKKGMIAGKSKLLGKDSIGVSVDNIFAMVHRRYQAQRKANNFLEPIMSKGKKRK